MRAALTLVAFLACGDAYLSDSIKAGLRPHHATGASVEERPHRVRARVVCREVPQILWGPRILHRH